MAWARGALTEPLREVLLIVQQASAGDGQDKVGEEILKSPFRCLTALCFQALSDTSFSC